MSTSEDFNIAKRIKTKRSDRSVLKSKQIIRFKIALVEKFTSVDILVCIVKE